MIRRVYFLVCLISAVLCYSGSYAQITDTEDSSDYSTSDLEKILGRKSVENAGSGHFVSAMFKSTRIINGHSIENTGKGVLDFRIAHRFGQLNEGIKNLYGLDNATTKFSFDYGITDWLSTGVGRSSFEKEYDAFVKVKLLRQTTDDRHLLSVSYFFAMSVRTMDVVNIPGYNYYFRNRVFYVNQLFVARKFNNWFSLQLMPTYLHYNLVTNADEPNDVFAAGIGGRIKISKRVAITGEYYYNIPGYKLQGYNNPVSLGVDIETGGHVFQLFFTNSPYTSERTFIGENLGDIGTGAIHIGFNISRVFTLIKPPDVDK